jgi:hypothetical protein
MIKYDDKVQIKCVDNNTVVTAEVLNFTPNHQLSVALEKSIKLILPYVAKVGEYQGSLYGRTFVTKGPKETYVRSSRG